MSESTFSPGSLISARGREWIVLQGSDAQVLRVRPVTGTEEDQTRIHVGLEAEPVREARFPLPTGSQRASHDAALLLRDALLLSLRRGAGPFRSFGQISVEPRAYQLVPLLMALKLQPVRLLVADDVGVGKTIEAGLIAKELLCRGDVERLSVLCPPHLVEQWVTELEDRFHIRAVAVTAASAGRLEDDHAASSIFDAYPHTVVSLDYIKSQKRRDTFLQHCPELVIVDEAHACAGAGAGRQQRYQLLRGLTESATRHLVLLTATPHSGDEDAFFRLLGLLDRDFERLGELQGRERDRVRERLGLHFVQRRRPDIEEWQEGRLFPKRETTELTYRLTGEWERFFAGVLDYCAAVVEAVAGGGGARPSYFATLALLRCAASSPVAAALALRNRAGLASGDEERDLLLDRLFDGQSDALPEDDVEPAAGVEGADARLQALIEQAERLAGQASDPKLKQLSAHLSQLIEAGFNPVVFCRFIATAHYLGRHLKGQLKHKDVAVAVVTGDFTADERREKVAALADADRRVLVATDCLSEGINLQELFDAVVHYDLSWNPTRHEQREGRVDRFGQESPAVRATLMYGADNPVDGAVLEVILRKGEAIRRELGVPVPLPDEGHELTQALLKSILRKRKEAEADEGARQTAFSFLDVPEARQIEVKWTDAKEKAKQNRTLFAQRRLKPAEVLPEWHRTLAALGGKEEVRRFTDRALQRLGSGLEALKKGWKAPLAPLSEDLRERLEAEGMSGTLLIDFDYPPKPRCLAVQRSHPLIAVLAEALLSRTLAGEQGASAGDLGVLGRVGCWTSPVVKAQTTVALLRLRHQLTTHRGRSRSSVLLVEEASALAWCGAEGALGAEGDEALALLVPPPVAEPPPPVRDRFAAQALALADARKAELEAFARRRAEALLTDHERVRESSQARGKSEVHALLPPDVIGLFVLLPKVG